MQPLILFLGDIGGSELMLIMVVILVFFGANKIPELARGLGKGIREFKDASSEIRREFEQADQPQPPRPGGYGTPNHYPGQDPYSAPAPAAPAAESGSGFDPWAAPATASIPSPATSGPPSEQNADEPAAPVAPSLPPNRAPEGTQPRQPYIPASSTPNA
ncbi:twin-arginine translocase TatA/TatE family subunit [Hymenobacter sp. BT664]|uniref:Sec-independent protein translocase protein TatA n=1 Tax=Hymenobacter montanus TaxID=2771359 RepID=A0A927BHN5_9BACT|nr:twin-arginine translocase TatA/TatE family subunit [Hymenobacter montanus]MBD2770083.1 twin-arginine translocase TatA/TatE family subunit [Hymenobacter montanus]